MHHLALRVTLEKSLDVTTEVTKMLELPDEDFKASMMKMLPEKLHAEANKYIQRLSKQTEALNGNFRTEKCNNQNRKQTGGLSSRMKGQRKESVNWKV